MLQNIVFSRGGARLPTTLQQRVAKQTAATQLFACHNIHICARAHVGLETLRNETIVGCALGRLRARADSRRQNGRARVSFE